MSMTDGVLTVLPAPEGYEVNFENPPQVGAIAGYFVTGFGIALAATFLALRLYTRARITRNIGLEDVAVVLSFLFGLGTQTILLHLWVSKISGVHAFEMPFEKYQFFNILIMVASILYVPCLGFAKISILLLYHRLSKLPWFKVCVYIVMGIVASYSLGIIFALIFPCQPISANWDLSITDFKCIDKAAIYLATAAVNCITDFIILTIPIPVVLGLQMRRTQKIAVLCMFAVGSATFVTSIVRLVYMVPMVKNFDQTHVVSIPCVWINVEANLVVITTSLPSLRSFLRHFFPSFFEESNYAPNKNHGYKGGSYPSGNGSKLGSRNHYGRMDSSRDMDDVELEGVLRGAKKDGYHANTNEVRGNASDAGADDDHSEKGIWQTKTVTVEYRGNNRV